jgi:hypothetical protein
MPIFSGKGKETAGGETSYRRLYWQKLFGMGRIGEALKGVHVVSLENQ